MKTYRCPECIHFEKPHFCKVKEINVDIHYDGECEDAEPIPTNGDRIRAMSNEELAVLIGGNYCPKGVKPRICESGVLPDCKKCWEFWLNAPADLSDKSDLSDASDKTTGGSEK